MSLQDLFYLTAIIFFVSVISLSIYLIIMLNKIRRNLEIAALKAKHTAENIALTGNTVKAGFLKMFLSLLGGKGGDKND